MWGTGAAYNPITIPNPPTTHTKKKRKIEGKKVEAHAQIGEKEKNCFMAKFGTYLVRYYILKF